MNAAIGEYATEAPANVNVFQIGAVLTEMVGPVIGPTVAPLLLYDFVLCNEIILVPACVNYFFITF